MELRTVIAPGAGMTDSLVIPPRFCGPPDSGNGGYVCGRIAGYVDGPVTVTLRQPPPLATPMTVERDGEGSVRMHHDRTLIAEAASSPGRPAPEIPGPVSMAEARAVAGRARYYTDPLFPECFVCGMGRGPGDGLRIFPGPLAGRPLWAAPWTPDPSVADFSGRVRPEVVWAAIPLGQSSAAQTTSGRTFPPASATDGSGVHGAAHTGLPANGPGKIRSPSPGSRPIPQTKQSGNTGSA